MLREVKNTRASLWISASAGTGKTKNLIDRILALLLNGTEPSHILCLTYTKAAAGEMLDRLSGYLNRLQRMTDEEIIAELKEIEFLEEGKSAEVYVARIRELYKKSLDNDWVNIKTIHSFGMDLIKRFPLETELYPGVKLCDDNQKNQMLEDAFNFVLKQEVYHNDLRNIAQYTSSILGLIKDNTIVKVRNFLTYHEDIESIKDFFVKEFETDASLLECDQKEALRIIKLKVFGEHFKNKCAEIASKLFEGSSKDNEKAEHLMQSVENDSDDFIYAVLTQKLEPVKTLCTKKILTETLEADLIDLRNKTLEYLDEKRKLVSTNVNISFFKVVSAIIKKFIENKSEQHLIDFDDVILLTLNLLQNNLSWVFYRIDKNLEHILVDEAQDTSLEQWEIVRRLTSEFFAHEYSDKTIFVVGDEKQSIYSFQGANVELFEQMHNQFKTESLRCKQKFYDVELNKSYRSDGNVLKFVDRVFVDDFKNIKHDTVKNLNAGVVEIVDAFQKPDDEESISNLAGYIANYIEQAMKNKVAVKSGSRAARPEDFLILFRHRKVETMNAICDELKKRHIPVSGVDRVLLKDEIIIEDLIALAKLKVFPFNDLVCACVLKSPIIGMSEQDLMSVCTERGEQSLWQYVLERDDIKQKYSIEDLARYLSSDLSVADFFNYVLIDGLREKFVNRLGEKCLVALEEFIEVCENYQKQCSSDICSFLRWFANNDQTIKKDFIGDGHEVRIMTVHASKGLQAPFVILADAHFEPKVSNSVISSDDGKIFWNFDKKMAASNILEIIERNEQYQDAEAKRLLYVALTRAESYLCILGEKGKRDISKSCWYSKLKNCIEDFVRIETSSQFPYQVQFQAQAQGLEMVSDTAPVPVPDINISSSTDTLSESFAILQIQKSTQSTLQTTSVMDVEVNTKVDAVKGLEIATEVKSSVVGGESDCLAHGCNNFGSYRLGNYSFFKKSVNEEREVQEEIVEIPDWYYQKLPVQENIQEKEVQTQQTELGDCIHMLLNKMSDNPEILWDIADTFKLTEEDKYKAIREAQMVVERYPQLFEKDSRSEVTMFFKYKEYRIDKIANINGEVWIIDFKTGIPSPTIPSEYKQQLSIYRNVYKQITKVNARIAVLWTQNLELVEIV